MCREYTGSQYAYLDLASLEANKETTQKELKWNTNIYFKNVKFINIKLNIKILNSNQPLHEQELQKLLLKTTKTFNLKCLKFTFANHIKITLTENVKQQISPCILTEMLS